jgi:hypothetical protein
MLCCEGLCWVPLLACMLASVARAHHLYPASLLARHRSSSQLLHSTVAARSTTAPPAARGQCHHACAGEEAREAVARLQQEHEELVRAGPFSRRMTRVHSRDSGMGSPLRTSSGNIDTPKWQVGLRGWLVGSPVCEGGRGSRKKVGAFPNDIPRA